MSIPSGLIETLRYVERTPHLLELNQIDVFDPILQDLARVEKIELADLLLQLRNDYPAGSYLLLQAIAASPLAGQFTEGFARRLSSWNEDTEYVDAILTAGLDQLDPITREWIIERPGVRSRLGIGGPIGEPLKLDDRPFPEIPYPLPDVSTVAGVQARLLLHEINCGPVTGTWNRRTHAALRRFQYECDHPQPGDLDRLTIDYLCTVDS